MPDPIPAKYDRPDFRSDFFLNLMIVGQNFQRWVTGMTVKVKDEGDAGFDGVLVGIDSGVVTLG